MDRSRELDKEQSVKGFRQFFILLTDLILVEELS